MVSNIGIGLGRNSLITGFGAHRVHRRKHVAGKGVVRKTTGAVVRHIGHAIVDKIASAVAGGSYKLAGGRKPKATIRRKRHVTHRLI